MYFYPLIKLKEYLHDQSVVYLTCRMRILDIVRILKSTRHNGFPVTNDQSATHQSEEGQGPLCAHLISLIKFNYLFYF